MAAYHGAKKLQHAVAIASLNLERSLASEVPHTQDILLLPPILITGNYYVES